MGIHSGWLRSVALGVGALVLAGAAQAAVVGGFAGSRTLFGDTYSVFKSDSGANIELNNTANHGLYGDSISFSASTTTATAGYLSGVDIFFTGLINRNGAALSAAEVNALSAFITSGGVVIAHGDNIGFSQTVDALLNVYGLDVDNSANNTGDTVMPIKPLHRVMNGPFGAVAAHSVIDSAYLAALSVGDGELIASYSNGFGAIAVVNPGIGRAGALLFLPDSETYGLNTGNFQDSAEAKRVFNNAMAWAVSIANGQQNDVPEPGSLALVGLALGVIFANRRRNVKRVSF